MRVLVLALTSAALVYTPLQAQTSFLFATAMSPIVQNEQADQEDLSRITDDAMLKKFTRTRLLVPVPADAKHYYLKAVPAKYRYLRPWSKYFLERTAVQFHAKFGTKLRVTSLVRTGAFQLRLASFNPNAAPVSGPTQSSHLTGATLDISKATMSAAQRDWMRGYLTELKEAGKVYGIEERLQPTFHIMVFKAYGTAPAVKKAVATAATASVNKSAPKKTAKIRKANVKKSSASRARATGFQSKAKAKRVKTTKKKARLQLTESGREERA